MKSKVFFVSVYVLALLVTAVNIFFSLKNYLFADINELPRGELVYESASPSGDRTVSIYRVKNCLGSAIRGELQIGRNKPKTIFWQTDMDDVTISWDGDHIIYFDNVPISGTGKYPYDCRRGTSLFTEGALADDLLNKTK